MKKNTKIGIFSMIIAIAALLAGPAMNIARADHGGDNGNRGRRNSTVQTNQTTQTASNSVSTGTTLTQNNRGDDNEGQNENNNNNNAALEARIQALETVVAQLSARVLVLEQKAGVVDVTAPVISGTVSTNVVQTAADISWTTNEPSTSKVYFSTATPVVLATAPFVTNSSLVINHALHLSGLTANTTYHYVVESKDASNNTALSPEQSFATSL